MLGKYLYAQCVVAAWADESSRYITKIYYKTNKYVSHPRHAYIQMMYAQITDRFDEFDHCVR